MALRRAHLRRNATATSVLSVVSASVVVLAYISPGITAQRVDATDGGVWVTSSHDGFYGRLNKPIGQLDAAIAPTSKSDAWDLDILQDGSAVVARDRADGTLTRVDVTRPVLVATDQAVVPNSDAVAMGGSVVTVLDGATGKLWFSDISSPSGIAALDTSREPAIVIGTSAAVTVSRTGRVFAFSREKGTLGAVSVVADKVTFTGIRQLGAGLGDATMTAVGEKPVVLASGTVYVDDKSVSLPDADGAVLQQPSAAADAVLVATKTRLYSVAFFDGAVTTLFTDGLGEPAQPVRFGSCVHGAWAAAQGVYVQGCNGAAPKALSLGKAAELTQPVFRVNRDQLVLNDRVNGGVWLVDDQPRKVDDWQSFKSKQSSSTEEQPGNSPAEASSSNRAPVAVDDPTQGTQHSVGARLGRTTTVYVLDNDRDPDERDVLAISDVRKSDVDGVIPRIAPDGQSVQLTLPDQLDTDVVHFDYTIDDGHGKSASARVTVDVRGDKENSAPYWREPWQKPHLKVAAGSAITFPVLTNWRDDDGDPVNVLDAIVAAGSGLVSVTPDGRLRFTAPDPSLTSTVRIDYKVSDGVGEASVTGSVSIDILGATEQPVAALTQADVAVGVVGEPLQLFPLANDLPGVDPGNPAATMRLASPVRSNGAALTVSTDIQSGVVTVKSPKAGPYSLTYDVAYGSAPLAHGVMRVDIKKRPTTAEQPVLVPDRVTLRGDQSITVDPLINDFDPAGNVLVVQSVKVAGAAADVVATVIQGHWVRIMPTGTSERKTFIVRYVVTNGVTNPVTGEISVTQLADDGRNHAPDVGPDAATVRSGDAVSVGVLANDSDADGDTLSLRTTVTVDPANAGFATVARDHVVFAAAGGAATQTTASVTFQVQDTAGNRVDSTLTVFIQPPPIDAEHDQPPQPNLLEARVIAGDRVTIRVPTSGVDPDGDSVSVIGLGTSPALGRVVTVTATTIVYEAFPDSSGTDTFSYRVADRFGRVGEADVRVGVTQPQDPVPPVAVDDFVSVDLGKSVRVDVLANDFIDASDTVSVSLAAANPETAKVDGNRVVVTAPAKANGSLTVVYTIEGGAGRPSSAHIRVVAVAGYNVPPVARDDFVTPTGGATTVVAHVLSNDDDPDGTAGDLKVIKVLGDGQTDGHDVTATVGPDAKTIPYVVSDGKDSAIALVHVAGLGNGAPVLKKGAKPILVPRDGNLSVDLRDYVTDPDGGVIRLTTKDKISWAPKSPLDVKSSGATALVVSSHDGFTGPASITFEVTDGKDLSDPAGHRVVLTMPVRVGDATAALRCPPTITTLAVGTAPISVDLFSYCHVWVDETVDRNAVAFAVDVAKVPAGIKVSMSGNGGRRLTLTPAETGNAGTGSMSISVSGGAAPATLKLALTGSAAAPPPTISTIPVQAAKAGEAVTVDLAQYVHSTLLRPVPTVVDVTSADGKGTATKSGSTVTLTPADDAVHRQSYTVRVSDMADAAHAERILSTTITLDVLGKPSEPGAPNRVSTASHTVSLTWKIPDYAVGVDRYDVQYLGGTKTCESQPCVIDGLTNGVAYVFTVRAHNSIGDGPFSKPSHPITPDIKPEAVTNLLAVPGDKKLDVTWTAPINDGSQLSGVVVFLSPPPDGVNGWHDVGIHATSDTWTGLKNGTDYEVTVIVRNAAGPSPVGGPAKAKPFGTPEALGQPRVESAASTDLHEMAVKVSWDTGDGNGRLVDHYTLTPTRHAPNGGGASSLDAVTVPSGTTSYSLNVMNDGSSYSYRVSLTNSEQLTSSDSPDSA
ncbi:MAG: hypothetical protein JWM93_3166, partial [Frankiales bacterium]|nr:hypothetical protein [Frankiales bacterium]